MRYRRSSRSPVRVWERREIIRSRLLSLLLSIRFPFGVRGPSRGNRCLFVCRGGGVLSSGCITNVLPSGPAFAHRCPQGLFLFAESLAVIIASFHPV